VNKAQRLLVAGTIAPSLRRASQDVKARKVGLLDSEGRVVGYTTLAHVQEALLRERHIELDVVEGVRPKKTMCKNCGKTIEVNKKHGLVPLMCSFEVGGCFRQKTCGEEGCDKKPSARAFDPCKVRNRKGGPWRCLRHSMSPEQQLEKGRKASETMQRVPASQRSERAHKRHKDMTVERRSEMRRKMSEKAYEREASMTPEQRSDRARKIASSMTPTQRAKRNRKISETKLAKRRKTNEP